MFWLFFVLSSVMVVETVQTLIKVIAFRRFFGRKLNNETPDRYPHLTLFAPIKGAEHNLEQNIETWMKQDYPNYKILFIVESSDDPAFLLLQQFKHTEILIAGKATDCGQKVHNLRFAIDALQRSHTDEAKILAFVDADCRLKPDWLRNLVAEVVKEPDHAASGYRWFTNSSNFGSALRSAWNASVLTLYQENGANNFAWGGSTAIMKSTFDTCRVFDFWKGSISDDYSLTSALKASGKRVNFVPAAIAFTDDSISLVSFLKWAFRQLLITRIYHHSLWLAALVFHLAWVIWIFSGCFFLSYFVPLFISI